MAMGSIRRLVLGEQPNLLWFGLFVGVLGAVVSLLLRLPVETLHLTTTVTLFLYACLLVLVTAIVLFVRGGLIVTWVALFPMVFVQVQRAGSPGLAPPSFTENLVGSLLVTLVLGMLAFLVGEGMSRLAARLRVHDPVRDADHQSDASAEIGSGARRRSGSFRLRRRTLLGGVGGTLVLAGSAGHVYGLWCETSPADVRVRNDTGRSPVPLEISVMRRGFEVFHATPELGVTSRARAGGPVRPRDARYDEAVPIGCSLPEDVTVEVTTDDGPSVTKTATFPAPNPPSGGGVGRASLRIVVRDDEIEIDPDISYWVV